MNRHRILTIAVLLAATTACSETPSNEVDTTTQGLAVQQSPVPERSLASRIPPAERLHYVRVSADGHLHGELTKGTRVDLAAVFPVEEHQPPLDVAMDLIQNIALLDVEVDEETGGAQLGFSLTPDETSLIMLAEGRGELFVLPRLAGDVSVRSVRKVTTKEALQDVEVLGQKRTVRQRKRTPATGGYPDGISEDERAFVVRHGLPERAIESGTYVDVQLVHEAMTMLLLQRVRVLQPLPDGRAIVSVTADEAKMLALLRRKGELVFTVRNREDIEVSAITKKTLREVLEDLEVIQEKRQIRVRKKPRKKKNMNIQIIRGDGGGSAPAVAYDPEPTPDPGTAVDENDFTDPADDAYSTFAADVDTGSYTLNRRRLRDGSAIRPHEVRTEEFINYFAYDYARPETDAFAVSVDVAPSPFSADGRTHLLRIGVQGDDLQNTPRKPAHLTFLVDTSGSMSGEDRLPLAKKSLRYLVNNLRSDDTVAIVTYSGEVGVALEPTTMRNRARILSAISSLNAEGGTAMGDGISIAYDLAARVAGRGHENRVVILSDGDANVGQTSWEEMLAAVEDHVDQDGITLSTIGFGDGNFRDETMEQLANRGNGNYQYIDTFAEAKRVFGGHLDGTLRTIAKDVKLQVEFNPNAVEAYRQVGYENRAIPDELFRDDKVDAGEIGAGHQVTALYEVVLKSDVVDRIATVRVRHKEPNGSTASEVAHDVDRSALHAELSDAPLDFQFAAAVAAFAEVLRNSKYAEHVTPEWIIEVARHSADGRPERSELVSLVRRWSTNGGSDFN